MNKTAVAMAADSAVTLGGRKVFLSSNKIFTLSKYQPVGIMIYGDAEHLENPWELIIKLFRSQLDETRFDTLEEYKDKFVDFLSQNNKLLNDEKQDQFMFDHINYNLNFLQQEIYITAVEPLFRNAEDEEEEVEEDVFHKAILRVLEDRRNDLIEDDFIDNFNSEDLKNIKEKYNPLLIKIIDQRSTEIDFLNDENIVSSISDILFYLCVKKGGMNANQVSGVVITGFGEEDIYPKLVSFEINGALLSKLRFSITNSDSINTDFSHIF